MVQLRYAGHIYRRATVLDIAKAIATQIFPLIYDLGLDRDKVIKWLNNLSCPFPRVAHPYIPDELKLQVCRMLADTHMVVGDVLHELIHEIEDNPPPGFRWRKDPDTGYILLVKHSYKGKEKGLHRGLKFEGKIFVGCWWATDKPAGPINRRIQSTLKKNEGGVFFKIKVADYTDYYGYAIVPAEQADILGHELDVLCTQVVAEGNGEYRLSAIRLDPLAERRQLNPGDIYTLTGVFKSIKYNHEINLNDLLLGRVSDLRSPIQDILRKYEG